jgi:hypothetical protein
MYMVIEFYQSAHLLWQSKTCKNPCTYTERSIVNSNTKLEKTKINTKPLFLLSLSLQTSTINMNDKHTFVYTEIYSRSDTRIPYTHHITLHTHMHYKIKRTAQLCVYRRVKAEKRARHTQLYNRQMVHIPVFSLPSHFTWPYIL